MNGDVLEEDGILFVSILKITIAGKTCVPPRLKFRPGGETPPRRFSPLFEPSWGSALPGCATASEC